MTTVFIERVTHDPEERVPFRAYIRTKRGTEHNGAGATEPEALMHATLHWIDFESALLDPERKQALLRTHEARMMADAADAKIERGLSLRALEALLRNPKTGK